MGPLDAVAWLVFGLAAALSLLFLITFLVERERRAGLVTLVGAVALLGPFLTLLLVDFAARDEVILSVLGGVAAAAAVALVKTRSRPLALTGTPARVDEREAPFFALARRYLNKIPCPRMMEEHGTLFDAVRDLATARKADGVVIVAMKFCDTWGYASTLLSRKLRARRIPVLRLEREYILASEGQTATRVQAFLESLGR